MTIEILERPALRVVGMAIRTRPMSPEIAALWPRFVARIDEIANPAEPRVSYGFMRQENDTLYYMAGVSVSAPGPIPPGMESQVIPAGTYASFSYPLSGLGKGFGEIYGQLLPSSGYAQLPGQPLFERYDEKFDPGDPASLVQIGIPVRRKA
jgi:AraC family transcriptional regulator